jgi:integral membrane sensor domain MASE1
VLPGVEAQGKFKACALWGAQVFGVACAYYAGTQLSVLSIPPGLPGTTIWISAGLALFCLLVFGLRVFPAIFLGSFLSNIAVVPPPEAVLVALGNTLAPVCACLILRRVRFRLELNRMRDALSLVLLGGFGAMLLSAALGPFALVIAGVRPAPEFLHVWVVWWSSDVLGVLVVTPLLLGLRRLPEALARLTWWRWLELAGLLAATFAVSVVATKSFGGFFLAFPLVVLAAWRFQLIGVAPCAVILSAVSVHATSHGYGLLDERRVLENALILQAFNGTFVLTGLLLAAVITEWRQARVELEQAYAQLAETVDRLQDSMLPGNRHGPRLRDLPFARSAETGPFDKR